MEVSEPRGDQLVWKTWPLLHRTVISPSRAGRPFRFAVTTLKRTTAAMTGIAPTARHQIAEQRCAARRGIGQHQSGHRLAGARIGRSAEPLKRRLPGHAKHLSDLRPGAARRPRAQHRRLHAFPQLARRALDERDSVKQACLFIREHPPYEVPRRFSPSGDCRDSRVRTNLVLLGVKFYFTYDPCQVIMYAYLLCGVVDRHPRPVASRRASAGLATISPRTTGVSRGWKRLPALLASRWAIGARHGTLLSFVPHW